MIRVDELAQWHPKPFGHTQWAHLWSDESLEELHTFALSIGLKREWFQDGVFPHYDITGSKRRLALNKGALRTNLKYWLAQQNQERKGKYGH